MFFYGASIAALLFAAMTYRLVFRTTIYEITTLGVYLIVEIMVSVSIGLACGAVAVISTFVFNNFIFQKSRQD